MPVKPKIDQETLAANYGWALSVLRSNPELSKLFDRAVGQSFTASQFVAQLRNTKWYKTRGEPARQLEVLAKADPAEYQRRLKQQASVIADQYYAMTGRKMGGPTSMHFAKTALTFGFNDNEIRDMVGGSVKTENLFKAGIGGTLGEAERQLRQAAEDYGLDVSPSGFASQLNNIARQVTDVSAIVNNYRQSAKSRYAGFAEQIDQGMTIRDIAEPYKQLMAKTLEISDKSLSVMDKSIQRALTYRPPATGKGKVGAPQPMAMWQFEADLKNDPRWNKTQNAQDSIMAAGRKVLTDMGLLGAGS